MEKFLVKHFTLIRTLVAILIGVFITIFLIILISADGLYSLQQFFLGPFASRGRFSNIFENAAPLIICGVAIAFAFQAAQFNVGAEGSFFISAAVGTAFAVSTSMPPVLHIISILAVSALTGALWSGISGILKAKWNASELVSSLMLNYVAYFLGLYLINHHFRDKKAGYLTSAKLPSSAILPRLFSGTRFHIGIIIAVVVAILAYIVIFKTKFGYELRMSGQNLKFAKYAGINIFKIVLLSQVISGLIAGMGGVMEVMGIHHRFNWQSLPGYGWDGVIVAIIGRNHPLLIIAASFFLSYLKIGGQVLNLMSDIPSEMISVIQSIIILLITAEAFLGNWKAALNRKISTGGTL
ncbi:MAG: ABC transporter permease [Sphaerochaetaceae bacterium]|nr:ABC transporter permease [Sphaerochaetaceae bacterium]